MVKSDSEFLMIQFVFPFSGLFIILLSVMMCYSVIGSASTPIEFVRAGMEIAFFFLFGLSLLIVSVLNSYYGMLSVEDKERGE